MVRVAVVAEYRGDPAEGMQVVSKNLVDVVAASDHCVSVIEPRTLGGTLLRVMFGMPEAILFTHGPGPGVVALSWILRKITRAQIIWVATRPDIARVPRWLRISKTAHVVICNRRRSDLDSVAPGAEVIEQFIGIDPTRFASRGEFDDPWPEIRKANRPIALHLGHLRRNRGLDLLAEAKRSLGDRIEIVVQGSPTFPPDPGVVEELELAGVKVRREYEPDISRLYKFSDLYVFPVRPESAGAIELPLGVLEAVACGTPVLSTDFGVVRQALDGISGVTFAGADEFSSALRRILDTNALANRPSRLPDALHAERTTETVLRLLGEC